MAPEDTAAGPSVDEIRSLTVFALYLIICASLSSFLTLRIARGYGAWRAASPARASPGRLRLFIALTAVSLGMTWFYMLRFFFHSYHSYAKFHAPNSSRYNGSFLFLPARHLMDSMRIRSWAGPPSMDMHSPFDARTQLGRVGEWLSHSSLFREAWETACANVQRFWSIQQIFGLTATWSVFIGWQSRLRAVHCAPLFMLLGQLVAVSFAMNLFFVALLVTPDRVPSKRPSKRPSTLTQNIAHLAIWITVLVTFATTPLVLRFANTDYFTPVLAIPHLLLFFPALGIGLERLSAWRIMSVAFSLTVVYHVVGFMLVLFDAEATRIWAYVLGTPWHRGVYPRPEFPRTSGSIYTAFISGINHVIQSQWSRLIGNAVTESVQIDSSSSLSKLGVSLNSALAIVARRSENYLAVLWSHPAITSVFLDGILCYVSILAWIYSAPKKGGSARRVVSRWQDAALGE